MAAQLLVLAFTLLLGHGLGHTHNALEDFNIVNLTTSGLEGVRVQVNATDFLNGDWVEVSWRGVPDPAVDDMLALYAPADADMKSVAPVKFIWAVQSPGYLSSGAGTYRFRLVNMRKSIRFVLLQTEYYGHQLTASSHVLTPRNANEPLQVHIALTGSPGEMLLQWTSLEQAGPHVYWGGQPGNYCCNASSVPQTYTRDEMCGPPASAIGWSEPGLLHQALMQGLEPSTRYYFIVGDTFGYSEESSFITPPLPSPQSTVKFLAIADLGQAELDGSLEHTEMSASLNTTQRMAADMEYHQLLIHNGDISYARGFQTIWDAFWDQMSPLTAKMPYMAVPGNHERDWPGSGDRYKGPVYDSGGECGVSFERRVQMPLPGKDKWWYSFDFGPIHFLQYSTEHDFHTGSEQYDFMLSDLKSVNRSVTPWLIVGGHRPYVIDSTYDVAVDSDLVVARDLQEAFDAMFNKYGVDMTWHGHHHSYQRSCPLRNHTCQLPNPGHAGAGLSWTVQRQKPVFMEVVKVEHGYMRVEASGRRLLCEVVSSRDGMLIDAFELMKPALENDQQIKIS